MELNTQVSDHPFDSTCRPKPQFIPIIRSYISVLKLGIVVPNLLTALMGMWLATNGYHIFISLSFKTIFLSMIGIFFILASGTSFNNYFDRDIDTKMSRTQGRALVQGKLQPDRVLLLSLFMLFAGTIALSLVHMLTAFIALIGWFLYSIFYTMWIKRRHWINTMIGSIPGAVPPLIGWSAASGHLTIGAWCLFLIMFLWQPPHFYAIAIRRYYDYKHARIPMLPVEKTFQITKIHMTIFVMLLFPVSVMFYLFTNMNALYVLISIALGLGWVFVVLRKKNISVHIWALNNFKYSLIYLLTLLFAMFIGSF